MAKRQKRFNKSALHSKSLSDIEGKKVNIVLNDQSVIFALILCIEKDDLVISNMRLTKSRLAKKDIFEIILDFKG